MLYHLFKYFDNVHNLPGAGMFQYISFRAAAAIIIALLIVIVFGRNIINFLRRKQIGEEIRDLGLEGQLQKKGTPTMGGVIILLAGKGHETYQIVGDVKNHFDDKEEALRAFALYAKN